MAFEMEDVNADAICELSKKLLAVVEKEKFSDACEALRFALRMLPIKPFIERALPIGEKDRTALDTAMGFAICVDRPILMMIAIPFLMCISIFTSEK